MEKSELWNEPADLIQWLHMCSARISKCALYQYNDNKIKPAIQFTIKVCKLCQGQWGRATIFLSH